MLFPKRTTGILGLCALLLALPAPTEAAAGAQMLSLFIRVHVIQQALLAFWGISAAAIFYYALRMILQAHKENAYTDMTNASIYALVGFAIISCAAAFAAAFTSDPAPGILGASIQSAIDFIITMSSGVFVLMIVISAMRMSMSGGDEGEFEKWRKVLVGSAAGVVIMFIANAIVLGVSGASAPVIVAELVGVAKFLLTIAGFACAIALIVAGIFLVISIDEGLKDRAKRAVISTLIALAIVLVSYVVIATFV